MVASAPASMVTADPQFGIVRVLRPFPGFEAVYEGQSASIPIMLTEAGVALDPRAGQAGYSPSLVAGIPTPIGSRVLLWLPITGYLSSIEPVTISTYRYEFIWRMRNTHDFRLDRQPYHYPKQGIGVPDSSFVPASPRVVLPAASNTITYIQTEPVTPLGRAVNNVRSEDLNFGSSNNALPLLPDGTEGVIQQGVADPATFTGASAPLYQAHELQALGDELLIGILRTDTPENWGFTNALFPANSDLLLSQLFAAGDDVGVYITTGTSP